MSETSSAIPWSNIAWIAFGLALLLGDRLPVGSLWGRVSRMVFGETEPKTAPQETEVLRRQSGHNESDLKAAIHQGFARDRERIAALESKIDHTQGSTDDAIADLEQTVRSLRSDTDNALVAIRTLSNAEPLTAEPWTALANISLTLIDIRFNPGLIGRFVHVRFRVHNLTGFRLRPTLRTHGWLVIESELMVGSHWEASLQPPIEISPKDQEAVLHVRIPMTERLAETLAFKPAEEGVNFDMRDMAIEIEALNANRLRQVLGWKSLADQPTVARVDDHEEFRRIRAFVKWREALRPDEATR